MTPRRPRRLSTGEIELWLKVAQTVVPRPGAALPERKPAAAPPAPQQPAETTSRRNAPVLPSYTPPAAQPRRPDAPPLVPFEKRYRYRVARGGVEIEGVMDLHGLTQAQAHGALHAFLHAAQRDGAKLVLVVTGKGRSREAQGSGNDGERGVLRRLVPHWLRAADLRPVVLGFEEASLPHGGLGALYVRLRRQTG